MTDGQSDLTWNERFEMWAVEHPFISGPIVVLIPASVGWQVAGPLLAIVVYVGLLVAFITLALRAKSEDR